jgi:hypothetical protein
MTRTRGTPPHTHDGKCKNFCAYKNRSELAETRRNDLSCVFQGLERKKNVVKRGIGLRRVLERFLRVQRVQRGLLGFKRGSSGFKRGSKEFKEVYEGSRRFKRVQRGS